MVCCSFHLFTVRYWLCYEEASAHSRPRTCFPAQLNYHVQKPSGTYIYFLPSLPFPFQRLNSYLVAVDLSTTLTVPAIAPAPSGRQRH